MPTHHTEFKTQLVAALAADSGVTGLLASASAVYYRWPAQSVAYPAVIYEYDTDYAPEPNREGIRRLTLTLYCVGPDPDVLDQLEAALQALLDESPSTLTTANWHCRKLRLVRSETHDAGHHDPETHQSLFVNATSWRVSLYAS